MARYAVYVCTGSCVADCPHGEPCVHGALGVHYPHPLTGSRVEAHLGVDSDGMMHEWSGKAHRCKVSANPDDPAEVVDA